MKLPIYLDYNATTPVANSVAEAMKPYLHQHLYGNPSSSHIYGQCARLAIDKSRSQVADLIGAKAEDIIFTGCATESNNMAIQGVADALRPQGRHIITTAIEHPSVAEPFRLLQQKGWSVTILPVDKYGMVSPEAVSAAIQPDTTLVSIMHANNEIGTIQPISEISAITRPKGIILHTDAAQSLGKIPVFVDQLGVDLLTLAGHKFYATKGVGALYIRRGTPINPIFVGAAHEKGLRPGTENVPAIVGMGAAAQLVQENMNSDNPTICHLRDTFFQQLTQQIPGLSLNGHPEHRLPNTLNLSFPHICAKDLLNDVASEMVASVGSACHEDSDEISGVLGAMGISRESAQGSIRFSLGRDTTEKEIKKAATSLTRAYAKRIQK